MSRRNADRGGSKREAMKLPEWIRQAIEGGLGQIVSAQPQPGHETSPERLAVLLRVEVPLNWQLDEPYPEGTLGEEMVTIMNVTVKYTLGMDWVQAIVINSDDYPKFYYTQNYINKNAGNLREIAVKVRKAFFDHISKDQVEELD